MDSLLLPRTKKQPMKIINPKNEPMVPIIEMLKTTDIKENIEEIFFNTVLKTRTFVVAFVPF